MRAVNVTRRIAVAESVRPARSLWARSRGLLGRSWLEDGEGLLLDPCSGIHTFGMSFPIDALFLDKKGQVVHLVSEMVPHRVSRYVFSSHTVLEVAAGTVQATGTQLGDMLVLEE